MNTIDCFYFVIVPFSPFRMHVTHCLDEYRHSRMTCGVLCEALVTAVQHTLVDVSFRLSLGTAREFWMYSVECVPLLLEEVETECLIALVKLMRNSLSAPSHQSLAFDCGLTQVLGTVLCKDHLFDTQGDLLIQVSVQALCNAMTGNEALIRATWTAWMTTEQGLFWSRVLVCQEEKVVMSVLVLVLNGLRGCSATSFKLVTTERGQRILAVLLSNLESSHEKQGTHFELGCGIIFHLMHQGYWVDLVQCQQIQQEIPLLKLMDSCLQSHPDNFPDFITHRELSYLCIAQKQTCQASSAVLQQLIAHGSEKSSLEVEGLSSMYTRLVLLLQITNGLNAAEAEKQPLIMQLLVEQDQLTVTTGLLDDLETLSPVVKTAKVDPVARLPNPLSTGQGFDYLKRECVRCIGTMCSRSRDMQDKLRLIGGIPLVLRQCRVDDNNPYIREHAILALRYILQDNPENQRLIEELKPMEAVQTPELTEMGLKATLVNGKVQLNTLNQTP
ncbi:spinocerebellar ataxia type 10 protein domain-containing protein [Spinellus fusiger]|nr:spinocerebellar ataxia type 10 protein domain-containing protein [Spinellus fusiger]